MKPHPRGLLERRPGVWYVRYADRLGKMRWKKAGTKTAALMLYDKLKAQTAKERLMPEIVPKQSPAFAELVRDCLAWSRFHKRSWKEDQWRMRRIFEDFGKLNADEVTTGKIETLKTAMKKEGMSNAAVNRTLALLSLIFRLAVNSCKIADNPVKRVKKLREEQGRLRFLSQEEEERLKECILKRWPYRWQEILIAIHTGMRQGEQYGLRWRDVDMELGMISLPLTKNGRPRHIPLNPVALQAFSDILARRTDGPMVVDIKSPRAWFEAAVSECGIKDFRWHDLRHTFGSRLAMAGVPIRAIQELMGHQTIAMTLRYSHLSPGFQREAVGKLATVAKTVAVKNEGS